MSILGAYVLPGDPARECPRRPAARHPGARRSPALIPQYPARPRRIAHTGETVNRG
ncbi:hypothetical protein OHB36_05890 [Streptomyces sp. NBC_00320]|uniref:hypothetical protein n=1 Tax=Streptomyces sp. NBC_00320 TaxID=2975711 RepID=UPI00224F0E7F|nr:hypothetical protein [Streptomyces sp. NBC_00320]MCX5146323.1 hypothetical protein [Streptomyces sp. NBC_00320]